MSKNVVERLQKIENDIKTVICFYDVSIKFNDIHDKCESQEENLSQINSQEVLENAKLPKKVQETQNLDFQRKTDNVIAQTPQDFYSTVQVPNLKNKKQKKHKSTSFPFKKLSTVKKVSRVKTNQTKDYRNSEKQDSNPNTDVINNYSDKDLISDSAKEKIKNQTGRRNLVSSRGCSDGLIQATSSWSDSVKHSQKDKYFSHTSTPENVTKLQSDSFEEKNEQNIIKVSKDSKCKIKKGNYDINIKQLKKPKQGNLNVKNEIPFENEKTQFSQAPNGYNNQQETVEHEEPECWAIELNRIIEKSNEKLKKMTMSKELALDIAKHLKEKYDEVYKFKQELMKKMLQIQKDNERLKSELQQEQIKIEKLKESKTKQMEEDIKNKEIMEENLLILKARICQLEKEHREEILEKQREIDKIQRERIAEIRDELKTKEIQAREIQRLSNEKCNLLTRNDELEILLNDRHLEKQHLDQRFRQLQQEVQMQKQHLKKKTKSLEETNKELELIRQNLNDLEETQKNLIKRTNEYEEKVKSNQEEMKKLQDENLALKAELENEKDALLIKAKIIEDQQETIKQLKEKSEEAKTLLIRNQSLERIINTEREEKLELQEAVECLKLRKDELKRKIKALESDLLLAPQEVAKDLQKTQYVLYELENQVLNKQKEWELQFQSLTREKEQACCVAEYATKKLMQTSSEFQKQSEAHKRLRRILAENFAEKENNFQNETKEWMPEMCI